MHDIVAEYKQEKEKINTIRRKQKDYDTVREGSGAYLEETQPKEGEEVVIGEVEDPHFAERGVIGSEEEEFWARADSDIYSHEEHARKGKAKHLQHHQVHNSYRMQDILS